MEEGAQARGDPGQAAPGGCPGLAGPERGRRGPRDRGDRDQTSRTADDYKQAGERYRTFEDWEREDLISNLVADLKQCPEPIQLRVVWHFWHCDPDYGTRVAQGAGIDLEKAKSLPPLEGRPPPGQNRSGPTYTSGRREEPARAQPGQRSPQAGVEQERQPAR